jgi:hypothetical protein
MNLTYARFVVLSASILTSLALAACSSGSGGTGTGTGTGGTGGTGSGAGGGGNLCSLASASDVAGTLSLSGVQDPTEMDDSPVTLCTYTVTGKGEVLIRYETDYDDASFKAGEAGFTSNGMTTSPVTGLGDEAYASTLGKPGDIIYQNTLVVLQGSTEVEIVAPGDVAPIESLAREILGKL